ncbi:MAG: Maf-like protein [Rhizobiaceae bacterium]|nr:Maf-like protein [Rhizobiaceae bacterium]
MTEIVLASKSQYRAELLTNAGVEFATESANIDEREVEAPLIEADLGGADIAEVLAIAKAMDVSQRNPGKTVIGSDQTLSLEGRLLHKPEDMAAARQRLLDLSGKSHELNSSVALVKDGENIWTYTESSIITFRDLDPGFIGRHVADVGEKILTSVGAYQIEGKGVQLFEKVEGDFFSIMGLSLLPLLAELRRLGLLDQ